MSDITQKYIALGQKIKERRKEMKLTMTELAHETNLSQSAISMIENGLRQPTLHTINRISQVLGHDFSKMLVSEGHPIPRQEEESSLQNSMDTLDISVLQFNLSLQLVKAQPLLPNKDLNNLVVATILEEAKNILNEKHVKKRLEEHVSAVMKEEIERKKRELDRTLNILEL